MNPSESGILFFFGFLNTHLQVMGWDGAFPTVQFWVQRVAFASLQCLSGTHPPSYVSFLSLLLFWGSRAPPETSSRYKVDSNNSYHVGLSTGSGVAVAWVSLNKPSWGCLDGRILSLPEAGRQMLSLRRWGKGLQTWWPVAETLSFQRNPFSVSCQKNKLPWAPFQDLALLVYTSSQDLFTSFHSQTTQDQNYSLYSEIFPAIAVPTWIANFGINI